MTSLAIAEGWTMTSTDRGARREIIIAWATAAVLAGALVLAVPNHDKEGSAASLWPLAPAAGAHQKAADPEGSGSNEACSDRDYANERC